jgi:cytochrome P450
VHYCLGATLTRSELAEALKILARRLPNPRRIGSPPWKPLLSMSGPTSLADALEHRRRRTAACNVPPASTDTMK